MYLKFSEEMKRDFIKMTILCLIAGLTLSGCQKNEGDDSNSVTGVSLNETSKTLTVGEIFVLTAIVEPEDATSRTLLWTSSNTEIAAVNNGIVNAIAAGETVISVSTVDGSRTASCNVTVNKEPTMTMTVAETAGTVKIGIEGSESVTVDWGDGKSQTFVLSSGWKHIEHTYAASPDSRTITITGARIETLTCGNNHLTALDVGENTKLSSLSCSNNSLNNLDLSKNTELLFLWCYNNELDALDVSKNNRLSVLSCHSNRLNTLNISSNAELLNLDCGNNKLSVLDISKNAGLLTLDCEINTLSVLDISKNTALSDLRCDNNSLSVLDVSKNTELIVLYCYNNNLSVLDVSKNTALSILYCDNNKLSSMDVSKNTALSVLVCYNNKLSAMDVSKNTALSTLNCALNILNVEALNALFGTLHSNTIPNKQKVLWIGNNPGTSGCTKTIAENKGWTFH
jgi:hypothetical protein